MITMEKIDKLRQDAGITLEDSYKSGSKYKVGDRELINLVQLAKLEAYAECMAHVNSLKKLIKEDDNDFIQAACNITCGTVAALIANEMKYCKCVESV